jgi:sulfoxide reductase heme-binding subunit YedZ
VRRRRTLDLLVIALCTAPALWLGGRAAFGDLGANPIETVEHATGASALRLLLATLAVTPLRVLTGFAKLHLFRRMLGLFAFAYVAMHFLWYLFVDQDFAFAQLAADVVKRPYVTAGFTALALLVPLAVTSTRRSMRRLGRRWEKLHRLVYPAAILACIHFWWQVKADIREPAAYAGVLALLLGWRLLDRRRRRGTASGAPSRSARRERNAREHQGTAEARPPAHGFAEQPPAQP